MTDKGIIFRGYMLQIQTSLTQEILTVKLLSRSSVQFSSVQSLSHVWLFATPWIAACQASLSITNSQSSLKLMSIESVMPSSHLILCRPLLLLPPIPPSIRAFSNESTLCMRWWRPANIHIHTHTHNVERPCVVWVGESKLIHSVRSQGNTYRDNWEVVGRQEQRCREQTCGHSGGRRGQDKLRA